MVVSGVMVTVQRLPGTSQSLAATDVSVIHVQKKIKKYDVKIQVVTVLIDFAVAG